MLFFSGPTQASSGPCSSFPSRFVICTPNADVDSLLHTDDFSTRVLLSQSHKMYTLFIPNVVLKDRPYSLFLNQTHVCVKFSDPIEINYIC